MKKNEPFALTGIKEKTYICRCGKSKNLPYCDGTHKELPGEITPLVLEPSAEIIYICQCGKSKNFPYCDGTHKNL
jgi:CDGSH-type Zn-finger protein